ncbi:hypothetical protein ACFCV3_35020 [Kribbella sp. NPDC056345]|uniref:hypothetical protein n=1 Tax=Kribbella sp. NPDC056345 TaxID=3345789 RepID=UPI0035DE70BF
MATFRSDSRPAGYYADAHDWPVGVKHSFAPDQVIAALNHAITSDAWTQAKQSLRDTPDNWTSEECVNRTQNSS